MTARRKHDRHTSQSDITKKMAKALGMAFPEDAPRNRGNCGVISTCVLSGCDYELTLKAFKMVVKRSGWDGCGTTRMERWMALQLLGYDMHKIELPPEQEGMTVIGWHRLHGHKWRDDKVFINVTGHVAVMYKGRITDQTGCFVPIERWRWRNKRIQHLDHITPIKGINHEQNDQTL